ncbi:MAG: hypothetical protein A3K19_19600 [Lentisphaerae bacterium RIFOXYB12_FULL_65_16]|nr:MAG: hypothetical protein A3K18_31215 [Lentisphaerae bacterium RIFOXYA12_64_32]OGV92068.1 MAG: hypothetical protein A3K19_19600 [Lentisphaerae bacterium RIFOXYB12_FULL_65_16]
MSMAEEIGKLNELKQSGAMSEEEYQKAKESLLAKNQPAGQKFKQTVDGIAADVNKWGMFIHLSQFCGYIVPLAGLIVPIVLWQMKKNDSEIIDRHGQIVVNWIITELILGIIFGILCFALIGIPLLSVLAIVGIVFPIVGAVKANNGEVWSYPCSIRFFK